MAGLVLSATVQAARKIPEGVVAAMSMMFSHATLSLMAQGTGAGGLMAFAPLLIIMVIFYVLLILPAQRRQKKTQQMLSALKNGDKVITNRAVCSARLWGSRATPFNFASPIK